MPPAGKLPRRTIGDILLRNIEGKNKAVVNKIGEKNRKNISLGKLRCEQRPPLSPMRFFSAVSAALIILPRRQGGDRYKRTNEAGRTGEIGAVKSLRKIFARGDIFYLIVFAAFKKAGLSARRAFRIFSHIFYKITLDAIYELSYKGVVEAAGLQGIAARLFWRQRFA